MVKNVIMYAVCTLLMVVTACAEQDQGTASTAAATPAAAPAQRLVQIASLNTAKANDEFSRNVEIMQARVREIANLNTLLEQEEEMSAQYDIEVQIEELMRRINEDNKRMVEAYRYNLSRKYIRNIEQATVFLVLTDEEVADIEKEAAAKGEEAPKSLKAKLLSICTLNTAEAAQAFQKDVANVQAQRDVAIQLNSAMEAAPTPEDKAYAKGRLDQVLGQISLLNQAMVQAYGFSISRNYILQIDKSTLYVWATEDEIKVAAESN